MLSREVERFALADDDAWSPAGDDPGGVVVVETIFAYPGLAKLMIDGVQTRDLPLVQACAMIFCATYVILILLADIASILSNPRLRNPK